MHNLTDGVTLDRLPNVTPLVSYEKKAQPRRTRVLATTRLITGTITVRVHDTITVRYCRIVTPIDPMEDRKEPRLLPAIDHLVLGLRILSN